MIVRNWRRKKQQNLKKKECRLVKKFKLSKIGGNTYITILSGNTNITKIKCCCRLSIRENNPFFLYDVSHNFRREFRNPELSQQEIPEIITPQILRSYA